MSAGLEVIYNESCPICRAEIASYNAYAKRNSLPIRFADLHKHDLNALGLTEQSAARRLHVIRDGELLSGVPAFLVLWQEMPKFRWLAKIVALPGLRHAATLVYDCILAPSLYAMHRRRMARQG